MTFRNVPGLKIEYLRRKCIFSQFRKVTLILIKNWFRIQVGVLMFNLLNEK